MGKNTKYQEWKNNVIKMMAKAYIPTTSFTCKMGSSEVVLKIVSSLILFLFELL
jgi:hypothetical protein